MPNFRYAWVPLTLMVTIAIYLHLRGLHPGLDTNDPARPLIEGIADLDETDESNNETLAPNENVTDLGES